MSGSSRLEQVVRGWLSPLIAVMDALGISPNAFTVAGLLLNFGAAAIVASGELALGAGPGVAGWRVGSGRFSIRPSIA